ncbi:MAG: YtxH domain-containing protein [Gemmatimonadota bacterium]
MAGRDRDRETVYVEREEGSTLRWFITGAILGAGLALLFAPQSGGETRRAIKRRVRRWRAEAEEKLDGLQHAIGRKASRLKAALEEEGEEWGDRVESARDELERRLAEVRSRRRGGADEEEEPVA